MAMAMMATSYLSQECIVRREKPETLHDDKEAYEEA